MRRSVAAGLWAACAENIAEAHAIKCYNGTFVGTEKNGVLSFKGIPFAKAPIGELRWKAPQSVEASDETFDATSYGKVALQPYASSEPVSQHPENMSEDCLTLNIWTTGNTEKKKPVMFICTAARFPTAARPIRSTAVSISNLHDYALVSNLETHPSFLTVCTY